jgi:hypothetical protein
VTPKGNRQSLVQPGTTALLDQVEVGGPALSWLAPDAAMSTTGRLYIAGTQPDNTGAILVVNASTGALITAYVDAPAVPGWSMPTFCGVSSDMIVTDPAHDGLMLLPVCNGTFDVHPIGWVEPKSGTLSYVSSDQGAMLNDNAFVDRNGMLWTSHDGDFVAWNPLKGGLPEVDISMDGGWFEAGVLNDEGSRIYMYANGVQYLDVKTHDLVSVGPDPSMVRQPSIWRPTMVGETVVFLDADEGWGFTINATVYNEDYICENQWNEFDSALPPIISNDGRTFLACCTGAEGATQCNGVSVDTLAVTWTSGGQLADNGNMSPFVTVSGDFAVPGLANLLLMHPKTGHGRTVAVPLLTATATTAYTSTGLLYTCDIGAKGTVVCSSQKV